MGMSDTNCPEETQSPFIFRDGVIQSYGNCHGEAYGVIVGVTFLMQRLLLLN